MSSSMRARSNVTSNEIDDRRLRKRSKRREPTTMKEDHRNETRGTPGTVGIVVSIVTHGLLLAPVIYIVVIYLDNYKYFSWHPICTTVGVGLLMTEAVFGISGETNLTHRVSRMRRVALHWILHSAGMVLMLAGLVIAVVSKNLKNKEHFASTHGKIGLAAIVLSLLVAAFGIVANNTSWLYPRVRPVLIKVLHAVGGIAITILLISTVINGTYSRSFPGSETGRGLVFASLVVAGIFILAKPLLGAISRSRVIFKPVASTTATR